MATIAVTKSNIETKVLTSEKVILLEFWAKWCTSCRDMYSILDEVIIGGEICETSKISVLKKQRELEFFE